MAKKNVPAAAETPVAEHESYSVRLHNPLREDRLPVIRVQANRIPNAKDTSLPYQARTQVFEKGDTGKGAKYTIKGYEKFATFKEAKQAAEGKLEYVKSVGFVEASRTQSGTIHEGLETLKSADEYAKLDQGDGGDEAAE